MKFSHWFDFFNLTELRIVLYSFFFSSLEKLTLNDEREPVFKMGLANEWLTLISDQGTTDFFHLPTIKAELAPLESSLPIETVSNINRIGFKSFLIFQKAGLAHSYISSKIFLRILDKVQR